MRRRERLAFRIGAEEASLVDGTAVAGIVEGYDVLVETDAIGFYHLVVNRQSDGVRIDGDATVLQPPDRRVHADGRAASRLSTSQARRTSASVVRALPTASRSA